MLTFNLSHFDIAHINIIDIIIGKCVLSHNVGNESYHFHDRE